MESHFQLSYSYANTHDAKLLEKTLDSQVYPCPITKDTKFNLCADKGYFGNPTLEIIKKHNMVAHIRARGEEKNLKKNDPSYVNRR